MKFPDSEIQFTPAFIGGGRVCPIDCLLPLTDKLPNFSAVSEIPRADLPLFIEAANNQAQFSINNNYDNPEKQISQRYTKEWQSIESVTHKRKHLIPGREVKRCKKTKGAVSEN